MDLHGWGSQHPIFERLLRELRPRHILEIGTWKGASAIHMARLQQGLGLHDAEIVCVDTWLGALEFWADHNDASRYRSLNLTNGFPAVYYTFLRNVVAEAVASVITPFPTTSAIAARFFKRHNLTFDLIYLDASHDYEDVVADVAAYWPLVAPGGALFGDDFTQGWPGVVRAVSEFSETLGIAAAVDGDKWVLRGPSADPAIASVAPQVAADTVVAIDDIDPTTIVWRFSRSTGFVIAPRLILAADGTLRGYHHANEARWTVSDGTLIFTNTTGTATTRFSTASRGADGRLSLRGPFLLLPGAFDHVLSETGMC
ncbi:MAG TPA: class I SAM-dependent methyltransferase [Stellaceae bacterium]|nr:class I SAM-dependent methyltransferase [Stellaceae bacterium]